MVRPWRPQLTTHMLDDVIEGERDVEEHDECEEDGGDVAVEVLPGHGALQGRVGEEQLKQKAGALNAKRGSKRAGAQELQGGPQMEMGLGSGLGPVKR